EGPLSEGANIERKGREISVSPQDDFSGSLICTGFSRKSADEDDAFEMLRTLIRDTHGVRRMGTAATDLCMVAEGIFDGFYEKHLNPWDIGAGILIVEEADGKVTDFEGGNNFLQTGEVVASNGKIHDRIIETHRNSQK
ncbi:MAG: inositol monophosphatase family protein, partial [Halobacteria archaeon]|nr:inositol monophosphatase family protein [Halobacteria archaeon]